MHKKMQMVWDRASSLPFMILDQLYLLSISISHYLSIFPATGNKVGGCLSLTHATS